MVFVGLAYSCTPPSAPPSASGPSTAEPSATRALTDSDSPGGFACPTVRIIDGDTFDCGTTRIRLQGIDAPERNGQCKPGRKCTPGDPVASTRSLRALTQSAPVRCTRTDTDAYGRTVARCFAGPIDLSCEQIRRGHAVLRYAPIACGKR